MERSNSSSEDARVGLEEEGEGTAELAEATAALQDLAITMADPRSAQDRLAQLAAMQASLEPGIQAATDGPYLVTNAPHLLDWLGQALPMRPQMALCRCGGSATRVASRSGRGTSSRIASPSSCLTRCCSTTP